MVKDTERYEKAFLDTAIRWSKLSFCERKKVGCVIVKDKRIIVNGFNGAPSGAKDEKCEDENGLTKTNIFHAEENAILYAAKRGIPLDGCELYVTLSPCYNCARMILGSGIKKVVYIDKYKNTEGLDFLRENGVEVIQKDKNEY